MIGSLIASLLPWAIPLIGVACVILFQLAPDHPTRTGTSAKPEGRDHHEDRRTK